MKDNNKDKLFDKKSNHSNTSAMIDNISSKKKKNKEVVLELDDNTSNNTGNDNGSLERFNERLKNRNNSKKEENNIIANKTKEDVSTYVPKHIGVDNVSEKKEKNDALKKDVSKQSVSKNEKIDNVKDKKSSAYKKKIGVEASSKKVNGIESKKVSNKSSKTKYVGIITRRDISGLSDEQKNNRLDKLEKDILLGLDVKLKKEIDNLKVLVSEQNDIVDTLNNEKLISQEEIRDKIIRLEEILNKIKTYIEKIEALNNNYRFEDIINLSKFSDQSIISNIVEYRDILESNNDRSKDLSDKYKMLDRFILLYREVFIKEEILKHNYEKASSKLEKTVDRDNKYDRLKDDVSIIEQVDRDCKVIIDKQNDYLRALNNRISKIDSHNVTRYRFSGVNDMLLTMLMYIDIMRRMRFSNPAAKGAVSVIATRRMLRNFNKNRLRTVNSIEYSADDLSSELYSHLDDVEILSILVDNTLDDIKVMKEQFVYEFKGKVPGYEEIEDKLNQVEKSILDNKKKIEETQRDINRNLILNDKKLIRVKNLNQQVI